VRTRSVSRSPLWPWSSLPDRDRDPRGGRNSSPIQNEGRQGRGDDPATIGSVRFVLFCVKLWDVENAGAQIRPIIGPTTAVIPLQNGIDASERLIPILGRGAVMGGVVQISATIAEPGLIRQTGDFMRLVFGELEGGKSTRGKSLPGTVRLRRHAHRSDYDGVVGEIHPSHDQQRADRGYPIPHRQAAG
jgi:hypothetical protein